MMVAIQRMVTIKRKKEMQNSSDGGHHKKINPEKVKIEERENQRKVVRRKRMDEKLKPGQELVKTSLKIRTKIRKRKDMTKVRYV